MVSLLVVDPLGLELPGADGMSAWSSEGCFRRELSPLKGVVVDYRRCDDPDLCRIAATVDGVILGGSVESAWSDSPRNDHLLDLIAICRNAEIPFLGVCFGAQLLGRALGGLVGPHPEGMEIGTRLVRLSAKGREHCLFRSARRNTLLAVESHADAVLTLPPECELLASTEHTPVQAFAYRDLLYGVQFHPELGGEDLRCLWRAFEARGLAELSATGRAQVEACRCKPRGAVLRRFVRWTAARAKDRSRRDLAGARSVELLGAANGRE